MKRHLIKQHMRFQLHNCSLGTQFSILIQADGSIQVIICHWTKYNIVVMLLYSKN